MWKLFIYILFIVFPSFKCGLINSLPAEGEISSLLLSEPSKRSMTVIHACDSEFAIDHGDVLSIESPNFGTDRAYPENYSCRWTFRGTCKMTLTCPRFWLSDLSCYDKLEVSTNAYSDGANRFCGHRSPTNVTAQNYMSIQFSTDRVKNLPGSGFQCEISCENEDQISFAPSNPKLYAALSPTGFPCGCGAQGEPSMGKIVNGKATEKYQYPWMVGIVKKNGDGIPFCGGSLVNNKYVLTAAHCVEPPLAASDIQLVLNEYDITLRDETNLIQMDAKNIMIHPNYTFYKSNDVALIELAGDNLTLGIGEAENKVWNICLPTEIEFHNHFDGSMVRATGWGRTKTDGPQASTLQQVDLEVISNSDCEEQDVFVTEEMMCALARNKDTCQGDSGGPLMIERNRIYTQIGITSSGSSTGCAQNVPSVYTRITEVLQWVKRNSADGVGCTGNGDAFNAKLRQMGKNNRIMGNGRR